ncbi:MAG: divalent-cation tolerance protein CutA [Leptolyngbyaceae cyanobacterium]
MPASSQLGLVLVTAGSETEAQTIANNLLNDRLAACVTYHPIQSIYRWQGAIQHDTEYQLVIKTDLTHFEHIAKLVTQSHSYELPEIIAVPIVRNTEQYGEWIGQQISQNRGLE